MTAPPYGARAPTPSAGAGRAAEAFVVTVRDDVDARIAGHRGGAYTSPPQPHEHALALTALLGAGPAASDGRGRWTVPVPGGRRTITLTPRPAPATVPRRAAGRTDGEASAPRGRT